MSWRAVVDLALVLFALLVTLVAFSLLGGPHR